MPVQGPANAGSSGGRATDSQELLKLILRSREGDEQALQALGEALRPIACAAAVEARATAPKSLAPEAIASAAWQGALKAALNFDAAKSPSPVGFCMQGARYAALEVVRSAQPRKRGPSRRIRTLDESEERLIAELERRPTNDELAEFMGISVASLHRVMKERMSVTVSLHESPGGLDDSGDVLDTRCRPPEEGLARREVLRVLSTELSNEELGLVIARFFEGCELKEAARRMNLGEHQAHGIFHRMIARLRRSARVTRLLEPFL